MSYQNNKGTVEGYPPPGYTPPYPYPPPGYQGPLHLVILILHHLHLITNLLLIKHNAIIMDLLKDINRVTRDISILDIHLSSTLHLNSTLHFLHPILNAVTPAFWKDAWQLFAAAVCLRSAARDMV